MGLMNTVINKLPFELHIPGYRLENFFDIFFYFCFFFSIPILILKNWVDIVDRERDLRDWLKIRQASIRWTTFARSTTGLIRKIAKT